MFSPLFFRPSLGQRRFPKDREISTCFVPFSWDMPFGKWVLNKNKHMRNASESYMKRFFYQRNYLHSPNIRNSDLTHKRYLLAWNCLNFSRIIFNHILWNISHFYLTFWNCNKRNGGHTFSYGKNKF